MRVDIVSDVVCPWCAVGYFQLAEAARQTGMTLDVHWHPFQLNPHMPEEGQNLREHLAAKYGTTPEASVAARERLTRMGAELGFTFAYADDMRTYNTFRAHQLLHWAATLGRQHELKMALFTAFFTRRENVGDPVVLADGRILYSTLESQGIRFKEVLIDPSLPAEQSPNRKPGVGMVLHHLRDRSIDLARSIVVGDRETDLEFARQLGAQGYRLGERFGWPDVVEAVLQRDRQASVRRETRETRIDVQLNLDRAQEPAVTTGLGFFDHMLEQLGKHSGIGLTLRCASSSA